MSTSWRRASDVVWWNTAGRTKQRTRVGTALCGKRPLSPSRQTSQTGRMVYKTPPPRSRCPSPRPTPSWSAPASSPPTSTAPTPSPNSPPGSASPGPTVYKWVARYRESGPDALADRTHARREQGHRTPTEVEALIVACREAHPTWGPRKLLPYLARRHPRSHAGPPRASAPRLDAARDHGAQRRLDGRLQRAVQDERRGAVLSAHRPRRPHPVRPLVPRAPVGRAVRGAPPVRGALPRVRPARRYPFEQRDPIRHAGALRALPAIGVVDQARDRPPADRSGTTAAERGARADAHTGVSPVFRAERQ